MLGCPSASEQICLQETHWAIPVYDKKSEPKQGRADALLPPGYLALHDFCPDIVSSPMGKKLFWLQESR